MSSESNQLSPPAPGPRRSDRPFVLCLGLIAGTYVLLLVGMLLADVAYIATARTSNADLTIWERPVRPILDALRDENIRYSIKLTLLSCKFTAILSVLVAVPTGYLLSRYRFRGRALLDAIIDIPIVLPPLVIGMSLLILFQFRPFSIFRDAVIYRVPAVVLAQFAVAAAFAVRVMRSTFDQIDVRHEQVALTLGCSRAQAFFRVVVPQAWTGILTAGTLAWARALGEFGPLLIFAGTTRQKTEVLSTSVFLEFTIGNLQGAVAVSLLMVAAATSVLVTARVWGGSGQKLLPK